MVLFSFGGNFRDKDKSVKNTKITHMFIVDFKNIQISYLPMISTDFPFTYTRYIMLTYHKLNCIFLN